MVNVSKVSVRITELSVQSANGTNSFADRQCIQNEIKSKKIKNIAYEKFLLKSCDEKLLCIFHKN